MKINEFQHQPVKPDTYEASMALNQLMRIGKHAIKLHNMIDDAAEMESWVAKKIDLAGDYVKKVYNYTEGEKAGLYDDGGMTEDAGEKIANMAQNMTKDEFMSNADELGLTPKEAAEYYEKMQGGAHAGKFEDAGDMDLIGDGAENLGLDPNKFDYYYDTSGAGYGEVRTKSGKSILQFEYDRDGDAEVSTMDNKTIANIKQGEQLPNNVTAKLNMIKEDANNLETAYKQIAMLANNVTKEPTDADDQMDVADDVARPITKILSTIMDYDKGEQMPDGSASKTTYVDMYKKLGMLANKGAQTNDPKVAPLLFKMMSSIYDMDKVSEGSIQEDAGEGHMSKSTLYHTAKYAIALMDMIKPGDDLEGWVQSKLNKAADYLQGVYNYEEYQKLNPYREELDASLMQKHAQVVQKNIDEILAKETKIDDIDTKPGMMRILAKRVNEVEKEIAKETRKKTNEDGHTDVPSAIRNCETIIEDAMQMKQKLETMQGELPSWMTQMIAVAASDLNSARDYLLNPTSESGILYRAGVKKYGKKGMKAIQSAAGKGASHQEIGKIKDKHLKDDQELEEGLKDWARNTAMAGIVVAGLAGIGSINDAIDNSIPAIGAMETALEMAQDAGNDELAKMIEKDLSDAKIRLNSGKDLSYVKDLQSKYAKFIKAESLTYESKLAIQLNQQLK